jgi:hypothetical protein
MNFYILVEDFAAAARVYAHVLRLANEHQFATLCLILDAQEGLIAIQEGRSADLLHIRRKIEARRAAGLRLEAPPQMGLLGLAYLQRGMPLEALRTIEEGFALTRACGQVHMDGLWHKWKALALLALSRRAEAESCLREGLAITEQQKARLFQLGLAMQLARLLHAQERGDEARQQLAALYAEFTEGHNTVLLKNAAQLLRQLEGEPGAKSTSPF